MTSLLTDLLLGTTTGTGVGNPFVTGIVGDKAPASLNPSPPGVSPHQSEAGVFRSVLSSLAAPEPANVTGKPALPVARSLPLLERQTSQAGSAGGGVATDPARVDDLSLPIETDGVRAVAVPETEEGDVTGPLSALREFDTEAAVETPMVRLQAAREQLSGAPEAHRVVDTELSNADLRNQPDQQLRSAEGTTDQPGRRATHPDQTLKTNNPPTSNELGQQRQSVLERGLSPTLPSNELDSLSLQGQSKARESHARADIDLAGAQRSAMDVVTVQPGTSPSTDRPALGDTRTNTDPSLATNRVRTAWVGSPAKATDVPAQAGLMETRSPLTAGSAGTVAHPNAAASAERVVSQPLQRGRDHELASEPDEPGADAEAEVENERPRLAQLASAVRRGQRLRTGYGVEQSSDARAARLERTLGNGSVPVLPAETRQAVTQPPSPSVEPSLPLAHLPRVIDDGDSAQQARALTPTASFRDLASVAVSTSQHGVESDAAATIESTGNTRVERNTPAAVRTEVALRAEAPVDASELTEELHARITKARLNGGHFRLRLNPAHLGEIEVRLDVRREAQADTASVSMLASASARDLLEAHIPKLRQLLQDASIELRSVTVDIRSSGAGADDRGRDAHYQARQDSTPTNLVATELPGEVEGQPGLHRARSTSDGIDLFA